VTRRRVRVKADDDKTVSPGELGIPLKKKIPNHEPRLRRVGLISLVSKAVPTLPAISYDGIGMIVITDIVLKRAHEEGCLDLPWHTGFWTSVVKQYTAKRDTEKRDTASGKW